MRFRAAVPALVGLTVLLSFLVLGQPARVAGQQAQRGHSAHLGMTDAAMKQWSESWWASHPRVGATSAQVPAATFTVRNFLFDHDNNLNTHVDTATVMVGESVLWSWVIGIHTLTSGTGSGDPEAGFLFDQPIDSAHPSFTFTFTTAGTYPFFCAFHEIANMRGVVIVSSPTGVEPPRDQALGFTADPSPNPTRAGMRFGFALGQPGRVRAEVFDVRGRSVAVVLDRDVAAGSHGAAWDGRDLAGSIAPAGVYYVRLRLPGFTGTRPFVIAR